MAEILLEKQVCELCGVDVRAGALFCYNCGGAVSALPEKVENKNGSGLNGDAFARKTTTRERSKHVKIEEASQRKISKIEIESDQKTDPKTTLQQEAKLKSAAVMRRKAKTFQKKEVEIVWEEQENPSSLLLILTALLLAVFAAAVIILAMTLK